MTPKEFDEKGLIPRPDYHRDLPAVMSMGFNPEAASDLKAVMQFNFSGEVEGPCYFKIENGSIVTGKGAAENPDVTIESPFELWMDILTAQGRRPADVYGTEVYGHRRLVFDAENGAVIREKVRRLVTL